MIITRPRVSWLWAFSPTGPTVRSLIQGRPLLAMLEKMTWDTNLILYVCTTSICFLFSQRDHNENKVYFWPVLCYPCHSILIVKLLDTYIVFCKVVFYTHLLYLFVVANKYLLTYAHKSKTVGLLDFSAFLDFTLSTLTPKLSGLSSIRAFYSGLATCIMLPDMITNYNL